VVPDRGDIYIYDSYVAAEHRGQRLMAALFADVAARYRGRGYRRTCVLIALYNRTNIRACERCGFRRAGTVRSFARGPVQLADFKLR
jgi:GNAT superfamily N-acetyltransferase